MGMTDAATGGATGAATGAATAPARGLSGGREEWGVGFAADHRLRLHQKMDLPYWCVLEVNDGEYYPARLEGGRLTLLVGGGHCTSPAAAWLAVGADLDAEEGARALLARLTPPTPRDTRGGREGGEADE